MNGMYSRSRSKQIIEMARAGNRPADIARAVGCSCANVANTIKRHGARIDFKDQPLTPAHISFIQNEADKSKVDFNAMARAMLVDYLADNMPNVSHET